jgi:tetratricopeptide (TPR) repeat protein
VSDSRKQRPLLNAYYQQYLSHENTARFVADVSQHYTLPTLERLVRYGTRTSRRAAVLVVGYLGGYESNGVLGRALRDSDRVVRLLAENGIRSLWCRDGSERDQHRLQAIIRLNASAQLSEAVEEASGLISQANDFAEVWNQRAIALYQMERYQESIRDCRQVLRLNPFHFAAGVGMGHCYLEMADGQAALECFLWALEVNPEMENVRAQVDFLQRALREK